MRNAFIAPLRQASAIRKQCVVWRIGGGDTGSVRAVTVNPALVRQQSLPLQQARRPISNCAVRCSHDNATNNNHAGTSPLGPVGVAAALAAKGNGEQQVRPTIWDEFTLKDRVALVSGANRGLGLEMALVLIEAGARAVYCVDLPAQPGKEWLAVAEYVDRMVASGGGVGVGGRLEYISADVRDQKAMWRIGEEIGDLEGRMDVCVAAAGILKAHTDCLEYPGEQFEEVRSFLLVCLIDG